MAHADRRANIERRVDHNIVTVLQNRLNICHQNASHQENQKWAKNYSYEYFCGELDETVREAEAAFELKWGKLPYRRPEHQMGKLAYLRAGFVKFGIDLRLATGSDCLPKTLKISLFLRAKESIR